MSADDYYAALGVDPDAGDAELAAALEARRGGEEPEAARAEAAFRILSDPDRRALYDELRRREAPAPEPQAAPIDVPANDSEPAADPEPDDDMVPDAVAPLDADDASATPTDEPLVVQPFRAATPRRRGPGAWTFAVAAICLAAAAWAWFQFSASPEGTPATVRIPVTPPAPVGAPLAANTLHSWSETATAGPYAIDGLTVTLEARGPAEARQPVLRVTAPGGETFEHLGESGAGPAQAHFGVGKLDPSGAASQVVFTTFSGGAHCCTRITVLDLRNGAWSAIDLGHWDGGGLGAFPRDENGDGRPEFVLSDDRFLYAFASYAESFAPPLILQLRDGKVVDASAEPGYRDLHAARAGDLQSACRKTANGACAAFAAVAARLGQLDTAWPTLLASYDPSSDWDLPSACRAVAKTECPPEDQVTFATFPESLRWFLGENGYTPVVPLPRREPAVGPSFDCTKVRSKNLRLVCTDPELSAADRELDRVFLRALALTPDVAGLRNQENAFLATRNNAPLDREILLDLYRGRIDELSEGLPR